MDEADTTDVSTEDVTLSDAPLGYDIHIDRDRAGAIEGVPGYLEYIAVEPHWEGKGVARAAVQSFVSLSRSHEETTVTTTNATNPAMTHILETEGFEEQDGGKKWVKQLSTSQD